MGEATRHVLVVGGGTAGSVIAARLSQDAQLEVTLLEAGPDHDAYDDLLLDPAAAASAWMGAGPLVTTPMTTATGAIDVHQGRILGGTSAVNGLATLRGQPADYDGWAAAGLDGWGWDDVIDTFIRAERDVDFGDSRPIHGADGPLPVRRWRRDELSHGQLAYLDGMTALGVPAVDDINDPDQLPGIGVFPVTIDDEGRRVSTSLAYLTPEVRGRDNLTVRTGVEVERVTIEAGRALGVTLTSGDAVEADEVIVTAGAIWTPTLLLRSGIGPAHHLADLGITVHADLPVGETMSDHLGPLIPYRHDGPRGGVAGPAQVVLVGASDGRNVDYHAFPIALAPAHDQTIFVMAVFCMRSSGRGRVRLSGERDAGPLVTAPPLPDDAPDTLGHAFARLAAWERSDAATSLGCAPVVPHDLSAPDAVEQALERHTASYFHMVGTCPMGAVLDADGRVLGIDGLRVADASVMPTIPAGNTYLGCVMVAERVAAKILAADPPAPG